MQCCSEAVCRNNSSYHGESHRHHLGVFDLPGSLTHRPRPSILVLALTTQWVIELLRELIRNDANQAAAWHLAHLRSRPSSLQSTSKNRLWIQLSYHTLTALMWFLLFRCTSIVVLIPSCSISRSIEGLKLIASGALMIFREVRGALTVVHPMAARSDLSNWVCI